MPTPTPTPMTHPTRCDRCGTELATGWTHLYCPECRRWICRHPGEACPVGLDREGLRNG
jgi:hypothetical protein